MSKLNTILASIVRISAMANLEPSVVSKSTDEGGNNSRLPNASPRPDVKGL